MPIVSLIYHTLSLIFSLICDYQGGQIESATGSNQIKKNEIEKVIYVVNRKVERFHYHLEMCF